MKSMNKRQTSSSLFDTLFAIDQTNNIAELSFFHNWNGQIGRPKDVIAESEQSQVI